MGTAAIVFGTAVAGWAWVGGWPWAAPAVSSGSDYAAVSPLGVAVTFLGCLITAAGVLVLLSGRGGPEDWAGR
jgi:hypothetical protein